ncbi:MAG: SDR family oxidoreductase [Betaproteobacteria bacterium]|nr:SDR family oxidoreductase [Betaproteobacteria bacterium]
MEFDGKLALVTGGASGIGLATVEALVQAGGTVYVADINEQAGRSAVAAMAGPGKAHFLRLDVTDESSVRDAVRRVQEENRTLDILVNAAGWSKVERFADTAPELWRRLIDLNYVGTLNMTHAFLADLTARPGARIVNVASDAGRVGSGNEAVYSGAKGAVIAFTKALARETARFGTHVNCVCPGPTDTPLLASIPEKQREALMRAIPFRRFAKPSEVANAVLFFAGGRADYITGQVLSVSGGLTMAD